MSAIRPTANLPLAEETIYAYPVPSVVPQNIADSEVRSCLQSALEARRALSVYIHVPFCASLCHFCGFLKEQLNGRNDVELFLSDFESEISLLASQLAAKHTLDAIYFGGGTPSILPTQRVEDILRLLSHTFRIASNAEVSFEGDVSSLRRPGYLQDLRSLGVTRISFGVQTFDPGYRAALNLQPSHSDMIKVAEKAMGIFPEAACDLIFGFPGQDPAFIETDLQRSCKELNFLTNVEIFPFEKVDASPMFLRGMAAAGLRPLEPNELRAGYLVASAAAEAAGFFPVSYTMFSRQASRPRHFRYYNAYYGWDDGEVLGIGRGAQSFFNGLMWGNGLTSCRHREVLRSGGFPTTQVAKYNRGSRELVTWPRRRVMSRSLMSHATPEYLQTVDALCSAGFLVQNEDIVEISSEMRQYVPELMEQFLPADQREIWRGITSDRLNGIEINESRVYVARTRRASPTGTTK